MPGVLAAGADGFLLGASLIIAIGAQNAFVLRQGLKRKFVFTIALICALSDALLIAAGVAGLGALVRRSEALIVIVTAGGAVLLFAYGLRAFLRAARPGSLQAAEARTTSLGQAVAACLASPS